MFTHRKFLSLSIERQHKKCAELLKSAYEVLLEGTAEESMIENYNTIQTWMGGNPILKKDIKTIADRFHWHLQQAGRQLRENNLLPAVVHQDKPEASCPPGPIAIYLDRLRSAHNIGSILRTVEAFALGKVYFSPQMPFIDHKQVQRTSMGAHKWVECQKVIRADDLPKPLIVLETCLEATPIQKFLFPRVFTLVVGNEEYGCSEEMLRNADYLIKIPLRGRKNSLNVANAFAICAAEIQRQSHHQ